jgi:hypothetical protein
MARYASPRELSVLTQGDQCDRDCPFLVEDDTHVWTHAMCALWRGTLERRYPVERYNRHWQCLDYTVGLPELEP